MTAGTALREARRAQGYSLEEVASETRISVQALRDLESNTWNNSTAGVFAKGFFRSYASFLGLNPAALPAAGLPKANGTGHAPAWLSRTESRARFGTAMVVMVLLILFTLALSMVLQPRRRSAPVELSSTTQPVGDEVPTDCDERSFGEPILLSAKSLFRRKASEEQTRTAT